MISLKHVTAVIADPRPENRHLCVALLEHLKTIADFGATVHISDIDDGKYAYDKTMSVDLINYFQTSHVLVVQLDGFIVNPDMWDYTFLQYDYCGAPWPKAHSRNRVGNGGFSLRSRRLHEFLATQMWEWFPDDIFISEVCGRVIVESGMRFAPLGVAARFSRELPIEESYLVPEEPFGFHSGRVFATTPYPAHYYSA